MGRYLIIGVVVLILLSFVGTLAFLWGKSRGEPEVFETEKLAVADIIRKTVATGSVGPRREIAIKPRVTGIIEKLHVEPGQKVQAGTLLAKIRILPNAVQLNEAEAGLRAARINFENAKTELERYEKLRQVVSATEYNQQRTSYELRQQELEAAESRLQLVREGASRKSGQATNLVHSTVAGTVLDVPVEEGVTVIESNAFNAGTTIALVADMSDMIFSGWVDEAEVGRLREGMGLDIRVGAIDDLRFEGELEFIAPKSKENEGAIQFEVRAALTRQNGQRLRAGYSANANIVLERRDQVPAINERVLQFDGDEVFVEIETAPGQWEKRVIQTGLSDGIRIEVVSGIDNGATVKVP